MVYLGIEFYLFVFHSVRKALQNLHEAPETVFHNTTKNKKVDFNPYIYTL